MRIAHVTTFYSPAIGGVKQVVEEIAERQVKKGHEVHVYTSDWDKKRRIKRKEGIIKGVHVHRCKHIIKVANFSLFFPSFFFKLLKKDFDIIHSHVFGHPHFVLSAIAAKLKKTSHIHTTHCPWTDAFRSLAGRIGVIISYNFFSKIAFKLTDKVIVITPWEKKFIKKFGGKENQIEIIPNGMSKDFFKKKKNNDFKKKFNIKTKFLVLFFGRLNITKAPDKFVEIAKLILKKQKNVTFVIRGPDEGMKEKVKRLIKNENKILLLSETRNRNEIIKMYQSADVYVLPSYREGLPLTLFEAMASGMPIVASPVNGIPYEIKDKKNGFLVKYGENYKFKEKIIELLKNKKLRDRISKNNLKKAKNYDWEIITKKTMKVYNKIKK